MFITDQSSKYTNITAPALYTYNDSHTLSLSLSHTHTHTCTYAHTHTHKKDTRGRVQYSTGMFNRPVSVEYTLTAC
jgi:hypothetical protein